MNKNCRHGSQVSTLRFFQSTLKSNWHQFCRTSQQTTTHDFICSVSEFTSSTGSIHVFLYVNSLDSVNKFGVSTCVYREITSFSRDDMYQ